MEYTVQKLAKLAGVSARTLRYYDQIGLLAPARVSASGYRIYGPAQVDQLQHILFYRELGMGLEEIASTLADPAFSRLPALRRHLAALQARQEQTALLIATVQKTIAKEMGDTTMTDKEKFEGFKAKLIEDNEAAYGQEIREKYGEDAVRESNAKMMSLTKEQYEQMDTLSQTILAKLREAVAASLPPESEAGEEIARLHREWLGFTWHQYTPEAHRGLADMYVADERFTMYYDSETPGCAAFLRDAIHAWVK